MKLINQKWEPFIGKNYENNKIILLGESNYFQNETDENDQKDPKYTKNWIQKYLKDLEIKKTPKFYKRIYLLLNKKNTEKYHYELDFWEDFIFSEIIQESMNYSNKQRQRPNKEQIKNGVEFCLDLFNNYSPKKVIVFGVKSFNFFKDILKEKGKYSYFDKINGTKPRVLEYNNIQIIFIKHPSMGFRLRDWRKFLFEMSNEK